MSQNTIVEPPILTSHTARQRMEADRNQAIRGAIAVCCLLVIGSFFIPWIRVLMADFSGYQLAQLPGEKVKFLWIIPLLALLALLCAVTKQDVTNTSQFAGVAPFVALIYFRIQLGEGFFEALEVGAYVILFSAAALFLLPKFLLKQKP